MTAPKLSPELSKHFTHGFSCHFCHTGYRGDGSDLPVALFGGSAICSRCTNEAVTLFAKRYRELTPQKPDPDPTVGRDPDNPCRGDFT